MKRILTVLAAGALAATVQAAPATASAHGATPDSARATKTVCTKGGDAHWRRCWTLLKTTQNVVVVETVRLQNRSHQQVKMRCAFSHTITRAVEVGRSGSSAVKNGVFSVVQGNVSATVHRSVTQTPSQARRTGSITLKPGQSATCQRTYRHVAARVKQTTWTNGKATSTVLSATVPVSLGVRVVR